MSNYPAGVTQRAFNYAEPELHGSFECCVCGELYHFVDLDNTLYIDDDGCSAQVEHYLKNPCCRPCYRDAIDSCEDALDGAA